MSRRRLVGWVIAALIPGLAVTAPSATVGAAPSPPSTAEAGTPAETVVATQEVVLVTGDVVTVSHRADGRLAVEVEPRTPGAGFQITQTDTDLIVLPDAAMAAVKSGSVDPRLFDVRYLVENGVVDARTGTVPVIVVDGDRAAHPAAGRTSALPEANRVRPRWTSGEYGPELELASIAGAAIKVDAPRADDLWSDLRQGDAITGPGPDRRPDRVWLDAPTRAVLDESVPLVGAPQMWADGVDGTGVRVAVLDTGWDPEHPDLAGKVAATADFSGSASVVDRNGHGTHVLSTVLGDGTASDGRYRGVAPGATGLVAKVLNDQGNGALSWAIAGAEWAVANDADIVSMSLGSDPTAGDDPLSLAIDRLSASNGTLFVAAAGNAGPAPETIGPPGAAASSLTVGNVFKAGPMNDTSSSGPRLGDGLIKPEVTAPGSQIVAARAANTFIGTPVDSHYTSLSGTSMATPHVAGVAALVLQTHPDWTNLDLRAAITGSARPTNDASIYRQGAGLVNAADAAAASVLPQVATLSFGRFDWPHDGDEPVTRTMTYRNPTNASVELDLAAEFADAEGNPAPVSLSASSLTVPVGGSASVDVTLDVDDLIASGSAEGFLTATDPSGGVLRTPLGLTKDPELFAIDVTATQANGRPAVAPSSVTVLNLRTGEYTFAPTTPAAHVVVPRGTYAVLGFVYTMDASNTQSVEATLAGEPEVTVDDDVQVQLDAREAVPVGIDFRRDVDAYSQNLGWGWTATEGSGLDSSFRGSRTLRRLSVVPSDPVSRPGFEMYAKWEIVPPQARLRAVSPIRRSLDTWLLSGATPINGKARLTVFDGGTGTPEELTGSGGKVAVVRRTDGVTVPTQVQAAQAAGAKAVIVANNQPGIFDPFAGADVEVPVLGMSKANADLLLAKPATVVELSGTDARRAPFLYDIVQAYPDQLPTYATANERDLDLAVLDTVYRGAHPGQPGAEIRHHWRPGTSASIAFRRELLLPLKRKDYVSAHDSRWQQAVRAQTPSTSELVEETQTYAPGVRHRTFFGGPIGPGPQSLVQPDGPQDAALVRRENLLTVNLPLFRDSDSTHVGGLDFADQATTRIRCDGEQIHAGRTLLGSFPVPAEEATCTLEADVTRTGEHWATSNHTTSTWRVRSARPEGLDPVALPLVDVQVRVDGLDLRNATAAPNTKITLVPGYQQFATGPGVNQVELRQSTDGGATWKRVRLNRQQGKYVGHVINPRRGNVSLRWTASDSVGNSLTQTVENAYLVD